MLQLFVAMLALSALVIADGRALDWTIEQTRRLRAWMDERN